MGREKRVEAARRWQNSRVILEDPASTYIDEGVAIGTGTTIGPNTQLRGRTRIGKDCRIDGSAYLSDAELGDRVHLKFSVVISESTVGNDAVIGPFAHLRPGTSLADRVHIGNFVETKKAVIGEGTKANHLIYLGDVTIGRDTNVGAGTITCNYDGFEKHPTVIGDRVQVGSDTTLVAPVNLGNDVYVATATTVRHDVPAGALVYNERRERVRKGWTEQKRKQMKRGKR
jgi:bifunctional UDP-N-acetylglucosamine pyrophosphorylase/glucosamine-1-phosphate N-acetyltransferase